MDEEYADIGLCRVCLQQLISYKGDIWHPYTCGPCPVSTVGRPGAENFILDPVATELHKKEMKERG